MNVNKDLMDITILNEGFELSQLWALREAILKIKHGLDGLKTKALSRSQLDEARKLESELFYVNRNIEIVETVMVGKEIDIFQVTEFSDICLN